MAMDERIRRLMGWAVLAAAGAAAHAQDASVPRMDRYELTDRGLQKIAEPPANSPEARLLAIRKAIAQERAGEAVDLATQWIEQHPNHPMLPEAYLLRGDAHTANDDFYKSLFDYEYVLRAYPASTQYETALERELAVAEAFARGVKRRVWGMKWLPAESEAEELFIRIQERAPGSKVAERAGLELAEYYYRRSEMQLAAQAYGLFLANYPNSQWKQHVMQRQITANLATFKGPAFDATGLIEAKTRLADYKSQFPAAAEQLGAQAMLTRVDESLALRSLQVAQWYDRTGNKASARFMYQRVLKDHAGSVAAKDALRRLQELDPTAYPPAPVPPAPAPAAAAPAAAPAVEPAKAEPAAPAAPPRPAPNPPVTEPAVPPAAPKP
jgi:outer membrane protein assembly factor BamD (BamD/ComL family)